MSQALRMAGRGQERHEARLNDLESLVAKLFRLVEAEGLAREVFREALEEIREIHDQTVEEIIAHASDVFPVRRGLHGVNPKLPLETLERYFHVLKQAAELEWVRSQKLGRKEAKKARQQAEHLSQLTHSAALAIKVVAQARGLWSPEYRARLDVDQWL